MRLKNGPTPLLLLLLFVCAAPLAAQAGDRAPQGAAPDTAAPAGTLEGITAANAAGTGLWTIGGFAGGALLGPIGTGLAYVLAESSPTLVPDDVQATLKKKGGDYALVFQQTYSRQIVSKRKRSALTGGIAGTALLIVGTYGMYLQLR